MVIRTIEEMENVVSKTKGLFWDGWSVVARVKTDKARTSKFGVCIQGVWYMEQRFEPGDSGWTIPEKILQNA
jgi:hypothetical protein